MDRAFMLAAGLLLMAVTMVPAAAAARDPLEPFRDARLAYVNGFRTRGVRDGAVLAEPQRLLERLAQEATGTAKAAALVELGTYRRLQDDFAGAVETYQQGAAFARASGDSGLVFEAELGAARAYEYGGAHGPAADALLRARQVAGPDAKQRHDLAAYDAQLLDGRIDLDAALTKVLVARRLAADLKEDADRARFSAEFDLATILRHIAELADFTPIVDARSDSGDVYDGSRRAVEQSRLAFRRAAALADQFQWPAFRRLVEAKASGLDDRLFFTDSRSKARESRSSAAFAPHEAADVLVGQSFDLGASALPELAKALPGFSGYLNAAAGSGNDADPRHAFLRGLGRDTAGDHDGALREFRVASDLLAQAGAGVFDPRRRGTVMEGYADIDRSLAMRLLSLDRFAEAFEVLENIRARGLDEVRAGLAASGDPADRDWLARLLLAEATLSSKHHEIAGDAIAYGPDDARMSPKLDEAIVAETNRDAIMAEAGAAERRARFGAVTPGRARLDDVQRAAEASGTAVVFYWVVDPNVIVWHVGPDFNSTWVRTVFLPEARLEELIKRVRAGLESDSAGFDREAAEQLYLYLIASITNPRDFPRNKALRAPTRAPGLRGERIMFVPQGALLGLPFEVLIEPRGHYLVERWETAYAPNATLAVRSLLRPPSPPPSRVTPVVGRELLGAEGPEVGQIRQALGAAAVEPANENRLTREAFMEAAARAEVLHVYAHGTFERAGDPLLSWLGGIGAGRSGRVTAAELVGVPVRDPDPRRLVVFSSCDGGRVGGRISNEIFGFAWSLLVSGVPSAVVARWPVDVTANAEWMGRFYAGLGQGRSPASATAAAMRAMRDTPPRRWAAMQVIGG